MTFGSLAVAQTVERERITPKPTPQISPTPPRQIPTPTPASSATPKPAVSPTANISPTPTPTQRPLQTIFDLQANIRRVLQNSSLQRGQVGVKIVSLDTGAIVFAQNDEKYLMPASNMKSFTMAAALDRLTPDFRFVTSVYAANKPDLAGTIRGDVTIYGRGDPTFAASLNDGDYYKAINALADKIVAGGVKRIEGNLVGDESYFTGDALGTTWEWDDLQWYYGAGVSALTINDNAVDVQVLPGTAAGSPCIVQVLPFNSLFTITNSCSTTSSDAKRELEVTKRLGTNILEIRGTMPASDVKGFSGALAVEKPAEMFLYLLKNALAQKGISVTGQNKVIGTKEKAILSVASSLPWIEIARLESLPLSFIAAKTLKPSQNLYTELVLRALGEQAGDKTNLKLTSAERGLAVVQKFLAEAGIAPDAIVQFDGSGLSRHNLITPSATVQLYSFMSKHRFASAFQAALPIGGVDGTLKSRFQNTPAVNNVHAKTGTIDQVSSLSGYLTTASGER
ncbi:MAG: D-alanyl-D-alanine carboxypeptidase/D-alanyl-D-alanine-endopeptidase, partial [Pyrinomonadaceae bacterium]